MHDHSAWVFLCDATVKFSRAINQTTLTDGAGGCLNSCCAQMFAWVSLCVGCLLRHFRRERLWTSLGTEVLEMSVWRAISDRLLCICRSFQRERLWDLDVRCRCQHQSSVLMFRAVHSPQRPERTPLFGLATLACRTYVFSVKFHKHAYNSTRSSGTL